MVCKNCGYNNNYAGDDCINCGYPLNDSYSKEKKYRMKLSAVKAGYRYLTKNYLTTIRFLSFFFLGSAFVTLTYNIVNDATNYFPVIIMLFISGLYFLIYILAKRSQEFFYLSKFALGFYLIHTILEFAFRIFPGDIAFSNDVSMKMSFYSLMEQYFPYIYYIIRIAIVYYFIKGLLIAIKIKDEDKTLQYFLLSKRYK